MKRAGLPGVRITRGPAHYQILQRRLDGAADIPLGGTWRAMDGDNRPAVVEIRVADPVRNAAVSAALDWHPADTAPDHRWSHVLRAVPAGGPYRIETRLRPGGLDDWRLTGDRIRQVGVGDLWVIAGQSNAVGYGHGPAEDPPTAGVHLFRASETWDLAEHPLHDPTATRHPANFDTGWNDHSPWLAFARRLRAALGIPIGLIPAALGGSPLRAWDPADENPVLFHNLRALVHAAASTRRYDEADLSDGGPVLIPPPGDHPGAVAGVVWHQGCSDTESDATASSYTERFARFVEGVRGALDAPALPFVTCQLNRVVGVGDPAASLRWAELRERQRAAAYQIPGVALVVTLDAGLSDGIHNSADGNLVVGERAARAALGMVYGHPVLWRAPDIADARLDPNNRAVVWLRFANVADTLWQATHEITGFAVADEQGGVAVRKAVLRAPDGLRLELVRPLGADPKISHAAGHNPPVCLRDRDGRPVVGFHRVAITPPEERG